MIKYLVSLFLLISISIFSQGKIIEVQSASMDKTVPVYFIKDKKLKKGDIKAVIYLLHPYSTNHKSWGSFRRKLLKVSRNKNILFVAPDGGYDSYYLNARTNDTVKYEDFIMKELMLYVDASYQTKDKQKGVIGISMGGYGAMQFGVKYASIFQYVGSVSGVIDLKESGNRKKIKKMLSKRTFFQKRLLAANSIENLLSSKKNNYYSFVCGSKDHLIKGNKRLAKKNGKLENGFLFSGN